MPAPETRADLENKRRAEERERERERDSLSETTRGAQTPALAAAGTDSSDTCNVRRQQLVLCLRAPRAASALFAKGPRPGDGIGGHVGAGGVGGGGVCGGVGDAARFVGTLSVSSRTTFVEAVASGKKSPPLDVLWHAHSRGIMPLQVY